MINSNRQPVNTFLKFIFPRKRVFQVKICVSRQYGAVFYSVYFKVKMSTRIEFFAFCTLKSPEIKDFGSSPSGGCENFFFFTTFSALSRYNQRAHFCKTAGFVPHIFRPILCSVPPLFFPFALPLCLAYRQTFPRVLSSSRPSCLCSPLPPH